MTWHSEDDPVACIRCGKGTAYPTRLGIWAFVNVIQVGRIISFLEGLQDRKSGAKTARQYVCNKCPSNGRRDLYQAECPHCATWFELDGRANHHERTACTHCGRPVRILAVALGAE